MVKESMAARVCWFWSSGSGRKYMIRNAIGPRMSPIVCRARSNRSSAGVRPSRCSASVLYVPPGLTLSVMLPLLCARLRLLPAKSIACWIPRRDCAGRCCPVLAAGPAAEGGLDAECVLVVTDGTEELALGDGGVPAVGPVAVAPLELPHRVGGVAERIDETAGLVGLPRQEAGPALNPPGDLRHRLLCFEEQVRLPLDPQSSHLERARQHAKGAQREGVLLMEPEGAAEALPELPFGEPLVAGTEGEELLVGVRPEAPGGRAPGVEPAAAEYPGERRVGAQAPHEPHGVGAESEAEARDHGRVDSFSGDRDAPSLNGGSAEEVVEKDDGGGDRREVGEADQ